MVKRLFLLMIFLLASCASFAYKYYGLKWAEKSKDVVLLGPDAKDDRSFVLCEKSGDCVVMFEAEFFKLRRDYEEKSIRLAELERRCGRL